jgi:membrane protein YqaA with SNARE-associated domain
MHSDYMIDLVALAVAWGYFGVFLASFLGSATLFLPSPSFLIVVGAGTILNPLAVGIIAGIGAALGELIGYAVGLGIQQGAKKIQRNKKPGPFMRFVNKYFSKNHIEKWFKSKRGFLLIFIFAATPLPDDVVGMVCGAIRYDIKKFFIASLLGKIVMYVALAYAGFYGLEFLRDLLIF